MNDFESALHQLPAPILDKLRSMIRRVRRLLFLRGLFATVAVALAGLLVIMAIDASVTLFTSTSRWVLSLAALAATLAAAWWFLVRPLSRRYTFTRMARILEIRHPELQERISTAVELLGSEDPDSIRGSRELIAAVVETAVDDVARVDPKSEFKPVRSRKFMVAAAVAAGVLLVLLGIWPRQSWILLTRAFAPFLDIGNAYADTLVVAPGDLRVAKGDPVTIQVSVKHRRLKRAEVRRRLPDGSEAVERMALVAEEPDGTKRFSLTFPSAAEDFDYRVSAGAALSEFFDITVVDPPAVENLSVAYDFPEYTGLPDAEVDPSTGEIRAVAHTRVNLTATLQRPVATASLSFGEGEVATEATLSGREARWQFELRPGMRGTWQLDLADAEGFRGHPAAHPLEVLPDKAPSVEIVQPVPRELTLRPTESLPIDLEVVEDFGFADLVLLVTPEGAVAPREIARDLPVPSGRKDHYTAHLRLDLPSLALEPGQQRLAVQVRVRDNRPATYDGPGVGLSETIFITLDQNAKPLADQAIEAQRREVEQQIREARQEMERARDDLRRSEQQLIKEKEVNSEARKNLDQFTEHNKNAREKLEAVAATLATPLFQEQSQQAARLADEPLSEAQEKADMIPMTDAQHERVAEAKAARAKVEEALKGLDELSKSMREANRQYDSISKLNQLANRQQELAANAGEWSQRAREESERARQAAQAAADENARRQAMEQFDQQQRREAEQFRNQQNQVAQQLGEMLKENAAALAEVLAEERGRSDALAAEATALAERQQAMRQASKQATENPDQAGKALREALVEQLAKLQSDLALQARAAATRADSQPSPDPKGPQPPSPALAEGAAEAEKAAGELAADRLEQAATSAREAGAKLSDAAREDAPTAGSEATASSNRTETSPPESGTPAESPAESASASGRKSAEPASPARLAKRQEAIREQIEAVRDGRLQEALAQMESLLQSEAALLEARAEGMGRSLENLRQNAAKDRAREARQSLERGENEAAQSSGQLSRAQEQQEAAEARGEATEGRLGKEARATMSKGQANQQQSAEALSRAAEALARSSEAIGQTLEGLQPSDMDERITNSEDLAEGFQDVARASQSQTAGEAASESQQAANSLQQLAHAAMRQLGGNPGNPNSPNPRGDQAPQPGQDLTGEPGSAELNETGKKSADWDGSGLPPELSRMGITAEDWTRFKGALVGGNAAAIESDLPAEYRELVGRYFQVIAKEAGKAR